MTEMPRRRLMDRLSASPTLIGAGTSLVGNMQCAGDLMVSGEVRGDAAVQGSFTLADGGKWEGQIESSHAVVAGEVSGRVVVAQKLEIRKTARIRGSVQARSIAIAEGAVVEGEMAVTSGEPVVRFEEKRKEED